jgi:hypothetical protein
LGHLEQNTIIAINKLGEEYPYAASMLIFVLIERELKRYVIEHRREKLLQKTKVKIGCIYVSLEDFNDKDDGCFLKEFISKISLGSIEQILKINKKNPPSKLRNDLMHSREYLLHESGLKESERIGKNKENFEKSKQHLIRIFKEYSDCAIVEKDGMLSFEPKKQL